MTSGCELHLGTERRLCDVVRLSLVLRVEQILIQESRLMTRVLDRTVQHASFRQPLQRISYIWRLISQQLELVCALPGQIYALTHSKLRIVVLVA